MLLPHMDNAVARRTGIERLQQRAFWIEHWRHWPLDLYKDMRRVVVVARFAVLADVVVNAVGTL